jgi:hypothetical protein
MCAARHSALVLTFALSWFGWTVSSHARDDSWFKSAETDASLSAVYAQSDRSQSIMHSLRLSAEQEKLWPPVEEAIKTLIDQRQARRSAQSDQEPADQIENIRRRAESAGQRADALKKLADAIQPLWATLSTEQKRDLAGRLPMTFQQSSYQDVRRREIQDADDFRSYQRHRRPDRYDNDSERRRDRDSDRGWHRHREHMGRQVMTS